MDRDRMTAMFRKQFELCKVKEGETMVLLSVLEELEVDVSVAEVVRALLAEVNLDVVVAGVP